MKAVQMLTLLVLSALPGDALHAQEEGRREGAAVPLRWTGSMDLEYYRSDADSQGVRNTFDSFRRKYTLETNGSVWDPRFNRFSLGLDLYRTDRNSDGTQINTRSFGYRASSTFLPNRPYPLNLYARRSVTDAAGVSLADSDRETAAWGAEWNLTTPRLGRLRALFDRTTFELLSPVVLRERRKTGLLDLSTDVGRSNLSFRYGFHGQKERVNDTDFARQELALSDRTRFDNGATLLVSAHYTLSDARFTTGEQDELTSSRVSTRLDLPRGERLRIGLSYDFTDDEGRFVDSTSHTLRTQARVRMGRHWESTGALTVGRIDTASRASDVQEDLGSLQAGVRYGRQWGRFHISAAYSAGYDRARFNIGPDRRNVSQFAELSGQLALRQDREVFATVSHRRENNDTTGVGFTFDESRISAGWEERYASAWRLGTSVSYRHLVRDTFQFGVETSDEVGVAGSLSHPNGGVSLSLSTRRGVSDFLPDPASATVFQPGTDLVSEADVAVVGAHWRLWRTLRFQLQARLENRRFTTIGDEDILSYHPRLDYTWRTWRFSVGVSHYQRRNSLEFTDDTWLVNVAKRFF